MEELGDILDANANKDEQLVALQEELNRAAPVWYITGFILLIGGCLVLLLSAYVIYSMLGYHYQPNALLFFLGIFLASCLALGLGYQHLKMAPKASLLKEKGTPKLLEQILKINQNSWKWTTCLLFFLGMPTSIALGYEVYKEMYWRYTIDTPAEWIEEEALPVDAIDEPIEVLEEPFLEEVLEKEEEDPAPPLD